MLPGPQNCTSDNSLALRLERVRQALRVTAANCGRSVDSITLVAVSKGQSAATIAAAAALGQRDFGENYLQEAMGKMAELGSLGLNWHFIGRLQANKTRQVAEHFSWVHTVDRAALAARLSAQRPTVLPPLHVCLQVNIAADARKAGVAPEQVATLARQVALLPQLRLRGLMCMLPEEFDADRKRANYRDLHTLLRTLRAAHPDLDTLSMGMSGDYPTAIAAGATLVRIGTAIFGARV
jgi:pyridoxal phosphate enzyme (YggS family)